MNNKLDYMRICARPDSQTRGHYPIVKSEEQRGCWRWTWACRQSRRPSWFCQAEECSTLSSGPRRPRSTWTPHPGWTACRCSPPFNIRDGWQHTWNTKNILPGPGSPCQMRQWAWRPPPSWPSPSSWRRSRRDWGTSSPAPRWCWRISGKDPCGLKADLCAWFSEYDFRELHQTDFWQLHIASDLLSFGQFWPEIWQHYRAQLRHWWLCVFWTRHNHLGSILPGRSWDPPNAGSFQLTCCGLRSLRSFLFFWSKLLSADDLWPPLHGQFPLESFCRLSSQE